MSTTTPKLLTVAEVADRLGMSLGAVYQLSHLGRLPGKVKIGRRVRFQEAAITKVIAEGLLTYPPASRHTG